MDGSLLAQTLCNLEAVNRLHPIKVFCHQPRFVALYRADAVPLKTYLGAQRRDFFNPLGNVVLTKRALPVANGLKHRINTESFGDSQQSHIVGLSPSRKTGGGDAVSYAL